MLRALGLGDFLTAVPALRALRRGCPDHELVLAAPRALAPLVDLADVADRLLDTRELEPLTWAGRPPELAVNLHGKGPQTHRLLAALHPARTVAFGCPEVGHDGPAWRSDEHEVTRWCRLVAEQLGLPVDPGDLGLRPPAVAPSGALSRRRPVVVHPGAAHASRRWPVERFAEVAAWLVDRGHQVVVTGGPGERRLAEELRRRADLPAAAVLAGETDLEGLASVIAGARLVVCGDTGTAHLATAYAAPSVVLFGPTSPALWGPPAEGPHTVLWHGDGTGDPWGDQPDPALLAVTVDEVVAAIEQRLAVSEPPTAGARGCAGAAAEGRPGSPGPRRPRAAGSVRTTPASA